MNPTIIIPTCKTPIEIAPLMCNVEGFSQGCKIIATCEKVSAAVNRNKGLTLARWCEPYGIVFGIVIMLDDDIAGFYPGWWQDLIKPLEDSSIVLVSARLADINGNPGPMMFAGDINAPYLTCVPRVPTACIAFRDTGILFDERFKGSGFEDDDFCAKLFKQYPDGKVVINNKCKMIHVNEQKNQGGATFEENRKLFENMWRTIRDNEVRVDHYFNIPKILHFVWIGGEMPAWGKANIAEFKRLNPDFQIMIHGEEILNPIFRRHWDRINHPDHALAIRADLLRLSALMRDGGWFFDVDFWPLVSIKEMCKSFDDSYGKMIIFTDKEKDIWANGILACKSDDTGLSILIDEILIQKKEHPEWWEYGTHAVYDAHRVHPELFSVQDLRKFIPITGKKAALDCMRRWDSVEKVKATGAFAIHFEMISTTNTDGDLCTTQNSDKTSI